MGYLFVSTPQLLDPINSLVIVSRNGLYDPDEVSKLSIKI